VTRAAMDALAARPVPTPEPRAARVLDIISRLAMRPLFEEHPRARAAEEWRLRLRIGRLAAAAELEAR